MALTKQPKPVQLWVSVDRAGRLTACRDKEHADAVTKDHEVRLGHQGPHRAVRLFEDPPSSDLLASLSDIELAAKTSFDDGRTLAEVERTARRAVAKAGKASMTKELVVLLEEVVAEDDWPLRPCNPQDPMLEWPHHEGECPVDHQNRCGTCDIKHRIRAAIAKAKAGQP